jgi:hypothetical protein
MRIAIIAVCGLVVSCAALAVACGSQGNNDNGNGDGGPGSSGGQGDGGSFFNDGAGGDGQSSSGGSSGGSSSGSSSGGANPCPTYQNLCNGQCVPAGDPNNCGGCGVACTGTQVCSAGKCEGNCMPGLTACNHACVDTGTDNANCGSCGHACPTGQGCVGGGCVPAVPVGPPPAKCAGGGPPINFGGDGGVATCAGQVAQTTFLWALCSCKDVATSDVLLTDAYDSTKGPYPQPGTLGGGVGLDNQFNAQGTATIGGALWCSAAAGLTSDSNATVAEELHVGGPFNVQAFSVGYDGYVNGAVSGSTATFDKNLTVPTGVTPSGTTVKGTIIHVPPPVSVPPPCDCTPSHEVPVASIVANFKVNNDNASIGLSPTALSGSQYTRLDLPCGVYYLDSITNSVAVAIVAHGNTALVIGGNIAPQSPLTITLDPTASLDLLVGGTITTQDQLTIGSIQYPALSRTYVAGTQGLTFSSGTTLGSNLYAANAHFDWSADSDIYGSVFAGDFSGTSKVAIHYDSAVLQQGSSCPPPTVGGGPDGGSGGPPPTCGTCKDCGNQACINGTCGSCTSSAQCCAPLLCLNGSCVQALQ